MKTTENSRKWMEDMETRKFHFQRPDQWPAYKTESSGDVWLQPHRHFKNAGREKRRSRMIRVRHAACMVYGIVSLRSDSELFVCVSVSFCCSLLFCNLYLQCCLHRVLRFFPFTHRLNVAIVCFIILDKVFWHNLLFYHDCSRYFDKLELHTIAYTI